MSRATVRRIGNSLGVIIPHEEARRQGLHEGDEVEIDVRKARTLADMRGALKGVRMSVDDLNDLVDGAEDLA